MNTSSSDKERRPDQKSQGKSKTNDKQKHNTNDYCSNSNDCEMDFLND